MNSHSDVRDSASGDSVSDSEDRDSEVRDSEVRDSVILIEDLVVSYGDHVVLTGVTLDIRRGDVAVIVGGSGSGKTTLLKAVIGLVPASSGNIRILDAELGLLDELEGRALRKRLGVMFQSGALLN